MLIQTEHLIKLYGRKRALDDVSLTIDAGQVVALLGPNGAGKTTLLRCLAGINQANSGKLLFDGETFSRDRVDLRARYHFVPDFPFFFAEATVLQHIGMVLKAYSADQPGVEERVIELLEDFDLLPLIKSSVGRLSRGQQYKVALIAMMIAAARAAVTAMLIVSRSRNSPTRMTSGSSRSVARRPREKPVTSIPTSRWLIVLFLSL